MILAASPVTAINLQNLTHTTDKVKVVHRRTPDGRL
jgi:hypothetical protein